MMTQSPKPPTSPLLRAWLDTPANQAEYLKRGQFKDLLAALGMGRHHVDALFPKGHPDTKQLPNCRCTFYLRASVLRVLGVSEPPT